MTKKNRNNKNKWTSGSHPVTSIHSSNTTPQAKATISQESIKGVDDAGTYYSCHDDLAMAQERDRAEFYLANDLYWSTGGTGGLNDDEAMVGDGGGVSDGLDGLAFLDKYLLQLDRSSVVTTTPRRFETAVDLGAGAGRVTKLILLKRYDKVRLVEGDKGWSRRSRVYLGRKRAARCTFLHQRLEHLTSQDVQYWSADLIWIQWTLQYLIDADVVGLLKILAGGLHPSGGIIVVKENRPFGTAREDRFQQDTPAGGDDARYDITRPDSHHRFLFERAGLAVALVERGIETNTYALTVQ